MLGVSGKETPRRDQSFSRAADARTDNAHWIWTVVSSVQALKNAFSGSLAHGPVQDEKRKQTKATQCLAPITRVEA